MRIFKRLHAVSLNLTNLFKKTFLLFVITGCSLFLAEANSAVLFEDDFNDGNIDANKWRLSCTHGPVYGGIPTSIGNSVIEEEGTLKIIQASTDWGGRVFSKTIKIDTMQDLIITCHTKSHIENTYVRGMGLRLDAIDPNPDTILSTAAYFWHVNYSYVPSGGPYEGFGVPNDALLPAIWDEWVDEKLVYTPTTGVVYYTLNGTTVKLKGNPLHSSYIKLDMQSYGWWTGHYFYLDWIKVEQQTQERRTPVIIIPGIMGSSLIDASNNDKVWIPSELEMATPALPHVYHQLDQLALNTNGVPINTLVEPSAIIQDFDGTDVFRNLISVLETAGYERTNIFVFPYDWRLDLNTVSGYDNNVITNQLSNWIDHVKSLTNSDKVDLICHSMGGLLAKTFLWRFPASASSIGKIITIGTPHLGSPKIFQLLVYGDDFGHKFLSYNGVKQRIRDISRNMPGAYQLLPSRQYLMPDNQCVGDNYFCNMNFLVAQYFPQTFNVNPVKYMNYDETINFLSSINDDGGPININMLANADALHSNIDNLTFPNAYNIVGGGVGTQGSNIVHIQNNGNLSTPVLYPGSLDYNKNGDGTVPFGSAEGFKGAKQFYVKGIDHMALPSADGVPQLVCAILSNTESSFDFSKYKNLSSRENCTLSGKEFSLSCPVDLHIYDSDGKHTGPNENGIIEYYAVGVSYEIVGDRKFAFLSAGRTYTIVGKTTDLGKADLKIKSISNNTFTASEYYDEIPLNSNAMSFRIDISDVGSPDLVKIDFNGDGVFEKNIAPDAILQPSEIEDLINPSTETQLQGIEGTNGYFKSKVTINLIGTDNSGGSGILNTRYSIDNGSTWQLYSAPLTINQNGNIKLLYYSTDRNGNKESVNEKIIKIDQSFPTISLSATPSILWPPNKAMVNVSFSGNAKDDISGIGSVVLEISDEYGVINKTFSTINCTVPLEAWRQGNDKDGRIYAIRATATDNAGNSTVVTTNVICPHDQGK